MNAVDSLFADTNAPGATARGAHSGPAWAERLDRCLAVIVEFPLALLLVAEVVILFTGVIARYGFDHSLVWSDGLAELLFLWLSMLGAVSASRRFEHMRMTALVHTRKGRWAVYFNKIALLGSLVFLAVILLPAYDYAARQVIITLPSLSISDAWRASALPVGIVLMLATTLLQLVRAGTRGLVPAAALFAVLIGALWLASGWLANAGTISLVLFFVVLFVSAVFASVPIAFAFGLVTIGYLNFTTYIPTDVVLGRLNEGMASPMLLAIPLFIFLGLLVQITGMARALVDFLASLLGHIRGGLSYALIGALYVVSGISGSKAADMAAVAPVLVPDMKRRGADEGRLVALLAATGAQTETVPPSIVLIAIGSVANVSIASLFTGGLLPAAFLGLGLCSVVWWQSRRDETATSRRAPLTTILRALMVSIPALVLPLVIRFAVVEGVATATEVATIGIVYALIAGLVCYRFFDLRRIYTALIDAATLSGAILFVIGAASSMAWALTQSGFAALLVGFMSDVPGGSVGFLFASAITFIVIGTVLEGIPAMVLFGPLLFPVATQMGINDVHYAVVVVIAMGLGLFAPPFGVGYYIACTICKIDPEKGMRKIVPFILALMVGLIVLILVPWLSTGFL